MINIPCDVNRFDYIKYISLEKKHNNQEAIGAIDMPLRTKSYKSKSVQFCIFLETAEYGVLILGINTQQSNYPTQQD